MPSENTEKFDNAPPVNRSSIVMETPCSGTVRELVERDAGHRNVRAETIQRKDTQREQDLLAQLGYLERIDDRA